MHEKGVGRYVVLFRMLLGRALTFLSGVIEFMLKNKLSLLVLIFFLNHLRSLRTMALTLTGLFSRK